MRNLIGPGSGTEKFGSGIRDKHPGSAILPGTVTYGTGRTQEIINRPERNVLNINLSAYGPLPACIDRYRTAAGLGVQVLQILTMSLRASAP